MTAAKMKFWLMVVAVATLAALLPVTSCDSVDAAFDCQAVCSRYRDCYNKDYDVDGCRSRCRANAEDSATKRAKADACESCIGGMSCLSATFNCAADCSAIVP